MYIKIEGLKHLEKLHFPIPPYQIIAINEDAPNDTELYIKEKIKAVKIPNEPRQAIGVTIRVSLPTDLDRGIHGGLHIIDEKEVLKRALEKYEEYGPKTKIIIQHTIDAKCSGNIIKENGKVVIEAIPGDAPPLHRGETSDTELWECYLADNKRIKRRSHSKAPLLTGSNINKLLRMANRIQGNGYLEWSISKGEDVYFYEYRVLS